VRRHGTRGTDAGDAHARLGAEHEPHPASSLRETWATSEKRGWTSEIVEPGEVYPEAAVRGGAADFGISFQESVSLARGRRSASCLRCRRCSAQYVRVCLACPPVCHRSADFEGLRYGAMVDHRQRFPRSNP